METDRQTDRQTGMRANSCFCNFPKASKNETLLSYVFDIM